MAVVPDKVLSWLYSSLKREYHNVDHTYYHIRQTLSQYPSITPRTEIYTYENGASALLLQLRGTLPVSFRGTVYRFPLTIWVPYEYPREGPLAYVTAAEGMAIRPGQHVGAEGRIYHPYLAHWANHWDKSNLLDFLAILQDVFAKEPPVVSKQQSMRRPPTETPAALPPPVPPPPQEFRGHTGTTSPRVAAPPPPPKPPEEQTRSSSGYNSRNEVSGPSSQPALPPKTGAYATDANGYRPTARATSQSFPPQQDQRFNQPRPPLPPLPQNFNHGPPNQQDSQGVRQEAYVRAAIPSHPYEQSFPQPAVHNRELQNPPQQHFGNFDQRHRPFNSNVQPYQQPISQTLSTTKPKAPVQDLLSAPLDVNEPPKLSNESNGPAPPIPPNPERDALLHAISLALRDEYNEIMSKNAEAIPTLEGQQIALQQALQRMQSEAQQLHQLDTMLSSNEKILHDAMKEADRVIESISRQKIPAVDDVLVAPTIVGEQLYRLAADERSIADAMFALSRALDKGRIGEDVFIKQTRSLAREQFMKKALIKKIADGMGLNIEAHM